MKKIITLITAATLLLTQTGVYAAEDEINVALHRPATASSSISGDNAPDMANDGINDNETYTYWKSADDDTQPYWQVDLGLMYYISKIEISARKGEYDSAERTGFRILCAAEKDFSDAVTAAEITGDFGESYSVTLSDTRVQYVKVEKIGEGPMSMGEIAVYTKKDEILQGTNYVNNTKPAAVTESAQAEATVEGASYDIPTDVLGTKYEKAVTVLSGLGIMKGYPDGNFKPGDGITRAEFAKITSKLLGYTISSDTATFSDVPVSHWAHEAVETAVYAGAVNGTDPGLYSPDMPIESAQAAKIFVSILGYGAVAEAKGGYPGGYTAQAADIGLYSGVKLSDGVITRGEIAVMTLNALNTKVLLQTSYGENAEASTFKDRTLMRENLKIDKEKGVVTGVRGTSLTSANNNDGADYIEIDNVRYKTQVPNTERYLGKTVEYYYDTEEDDRAEIYVIVPTESNDVLIVDADDIKSVGTGKLTYLVDEREKTATFSATADVIYNGQALRNWTKADLKPDYGSITLIDNDNDGVYDVYMVNSIENYVVNSVNIEKEIITSKVGGKMLKLDSDENIVTLLDAKTGTEAALEEIEEWNVLSVYESVNTSGKKVVKVVRSSESVEGRLDGTSDDYVIINDKEYDTWGGFDGFDAKVGDEGMFYLDANGRVAAFDKGGVSAMKYGYLIKAAEKDGMDSTLEMKILAQSGGVAKFEADLNRLMVDSVKTTTVSAALDKLRANCDTAGEVYQPIRYKTNAGGKITELDTLTQTSGEDDDALVKIYDTYTDHTLQKIYYTPTGTFEAQFGINDDTVMMKIPEDDLDDEDEYEVITSASLGVDQQYRVRAYNREDGNIVKLLLVYGDMAKSEIVQNKLMLVDKIINTVDEDGDAVLKVCGLYDGVKVEYPEYEDGVINAGDLKRGDIITLTLTDGNKIKSYEKKFYKDGIPSDVTHLAVSQDSPKSGNVDNTFYAYGKAMTMKDGIMALELSDGTVMTINTNYNELDIYAYSGAKDKVRVTDSSNIYDAKSVGDDDASYVMVRITARRESELIVFEKD